MANLLPGPRVRISLWQGQPVMEGVVVHWDMLPTMTGVAIVLIKTGNMAGAFKTFYADNLEYIDG